MTEAYEKYLFSDEWKILRAKRIKMDGGKCVICGRTENLQVHHLWYSEVDTTDNLVTLCAICHHDIHAFYHTVEESIDRGELGTEIQNVKDALFQLSEKFEKIKDGFVFRRSKEFSGTGDICFFTGQNRYHIPDHLGHYGTKLNHYLDALTDFQPYEWKLLTDLLAISFHPKRGFSDYQGLRTELFGTVRNQKEFDFQRLLEYVQKYGKDSVYGSYFDFLTEKYERS